MKTLLLAVVSISLLFGIDADEIIRKMDNNLQSDSGYSKLVMLMKSERNERKMVMESWNEGTEKSFIRIEYPKRDKGITFLKMDNAMWQYVPRIDKTIKIPSSMMMSSFMGSDFTNDDMAKESSVIEDYTKSISKEDSEYYFIDLLPKEDAAVVWGKIEIKINKSNFVPIEANYYDEDMVKQRVLLYEDIKAFGKRLYPTKWVLKSMDKPDNLTTILMEEVDFDTKVDPEMFTKRGLKRFSK